MISRRSMMKALAGAVPAGYLAQHINLAAAATTEPSRSIANGPFAGNWESLKNYQTPDWFRDAKFGIWAHWSAQCVPEQGDWYARRMYIQGDPKYDHHFRTFGHPTKFGFMEMNNLWKADKWNPGELMDLYVKAGAKYFVSLANHHDNFDNYDSTHHAWNSTRVGPKRDIVGTWAKLARERGLRFGVSNHAAHAWHWFQTAYGYDAEGEFAGQRYDAFTLRKEDGRGTWWEGLDPQDLYTGRNMVIPDGIKTIKAAADWHQQNDRKWTEAPPANNPKFVENWFLRCQELVDKYQPDLLYYDNQDLPLGQAGLDMTAHFYNQSIKWHGSLQAVVNAKKLPADRQKAVVYDIERGRADNTLARPWQTCTCLGSWHYDRGIAESHRYKSAATVIRTLIDIVSKNGNLLLSVPMRGDGTIDDDERQILADLAGWMSTNAEAIYGTRPFSTFGEGARLPQKGGAINEREARAYTAEDIRFTVKGDALYAFVLAWPTDGKARINTLAGGTKHLEKPIRRIELLGGGPVEFRQEQDALHVTMPEKRPNEITAVLKILSA